MHEASSAFAADPQSMECRSSMVQASRNLLLVVTRLLIVADVADVSKLINVSSRVSGYVCMCPLVCDFTVTSDVHTFTYMVSRRIGYLIMMLHWPSVTTELHKFFLLHFFQFCASYWLAQSQILIKTHNGN